MYDRKRYVAQAYSYTKIKRFKLMKVDIYIVGCKKDQLWLTWLLRSIDKFATGFRQIIIIADLGDNLIIECNKPHSYFEVPFPMTTNTRAGYCWQQVLKLRWMEFTDADAVVIFDTDTILTGHVDSSEWFINDKPIYIYRPWEEAGPGIMWKAGVDIFMRGDTKNDYMIWMGFIWTRRATEGFLRYMRDFHNMIPDTYLLNKKARYFSEFSAFGNFIESVNCGYEIIYIGNYIKGKVIPTRHFCSPDAEKYRKEIENILNL